MNVRGLAVKYYHWINRLLSRRTGISHQKLGGKLTTSAYKDEFAAL